MAAYTDNQGKTWPIEFSDEALEQVRVLLGIDLTSGDPLDSLADRGVLLRTAQILCRDEIAAVNMPTRQFMRRTVDFDPTGLRWAIRNAADEWQSPPPAEPEPFFELEPMEE